MTSNTKEAVMRRRSDRLHRTQEETERLVSILKKLPGVRRIILFGSLARGEGSSRSDIDLVIVRETSASYLQRLEDILALVVPRIQVDLLVYTPQEWEGLSESNPLARRINREGIVLHETQA